MRGLAALALAVCCALLLCCPACSGVATKNEVTLQEAIKARTDVALLVVDLGALDPEVRQPMRKVIVRGDSQQMAANILLTKDEYSEAVHAYQQAAAFYRQALDGKRILERLAQARAKLDRARILAEAAADAETLDEARRLAMNSDTYEEAGEFEGAIAELEKARQTYEALIAPPARPTTLEEAVAARTVMLAARKQVRDLPDLGVGGEQEGMPIRRPAPRRPQPPPTVAGLRRGSLPDLVQRGLSAERAAPEALDGREYTPAGALFVQAEQLYRQAAGLQSTRDKVLIVQKTARESRKFADSAFKTDARPASFERGRQYLADGDKARDADFDKAKQFFSEAVAFFAKAQSEAGLANAQAAWAAAVAGSDTALLARHAAGEAAAARAKAAAAEEKAPPAQLQDAVALLNDATQALKAATAKAVTAENAARAPSVIVRLEAEVAQKDKFAAEGTLAELEKLIPADARLPGLREKVDALPGPRRELTLDLGDGLKVEFVLIRPGSFVMGTDKDLLLVLDMNGVTTEKNTREKPAHKLDIGKSLYLGKHPVTQDPFYLGKYLVTQEQWKAVMGTDPSWFKGARLPVEQVSWSDCRDFASALNAKFPGKSFRLPSEAEWEYACRAGTATEFFCGDNAADVSDYAWFNSNSDGKPHPVGEKKPNPWGLYDMYGNVWEWCQSEYKPYPYAADDGREDSGVVEWRSLRGGAWNYSASFCRSAARGAAWPSRRYHHIGCRLVMSVQE